MDPEQRLIEVIRTEFKNLISPDDPPLLSAIIQHLRYGPTKRNVIFSCRPDGSQAYLNEQHPIIQRYLASESYHNEDLYFILSAIYSIINRALREVEDKHERDFHRRILNRLLQNPDSGTIDKQSAYRKR